MKENYTEKRYQSLCTKHGYLNENATPEGAWASIYNHEEKTMCDSHKFVKVVSEEISLRDLFDED